MRYITIEKVRELYQENPRLRSYYRNIHFTDDRTEVARMAQAVKDIFMAHSKTIEGKPL